MPSVNDRHLEIFFFYIKERELIRQKKAHGETFPWSADPILSTFKFTNVLRFHDKTTQWVYHNWYKPNRDKPLECQAANCAIFRYFGTQEFAEELGYQDHFVPDEIIGTADDMMSRGKKVFTGAYIITNQGISAPKQEVVVKYFLTPFVENVGKLVTIARETKSWEKTLNFMGKLSGFGPFMRKEVGLDMMLTPILEDCIDKYSWSPAGPGAIRGLNRLLGLDKDKGMNQDQALSHMRWLLPLVQEEMKKYTHMEIIMKEFGVTDVQFCLCEFDKYLRVQYNEGRPRSIYKAAKDHR